MRYLILTLFMFFSASKYETQKYNVIVSDNDFEIRYYPKALKENISAERTIEFVNIYKNYEKNNKLLYRVYLPNLIEELPDDYFDIVWASGQFLTEHLPDDYDQWSNEKLDDFIDDHKWEPFENYDPSFIWDQILNLAKSMREYIDQT